MLECNVEWSTLLREVAEHGAAFAARVVAQPYCAKLAAELSGGPYEPLVPVVGPIRQQGEAFKVGIAQLRPRYPVLAGLCDELVDQVHRHGISQWAPNEVAIQRYQPGSLGITPHRDQRRFAQLVAVVTVAGSAPFTLCRDRAGDPIHTWQAGAGSLLLLRGPGLSGDDGRPMHSVGGPTGAIPRTSVGIRMETS
ncbi:MAG: hypothetical protein JO296_21200 [Pseudonocardiales bacterium]|nr:hypothetical protein [Pseudonocardiales bacterium]